MATIVKGKNAKKPYTVRYWVDGRQRELSFVTSREARDWKAKVEHDTRAQIFVDPAASNIKFRDVAERWVAHLTGAPRSKEIYRSLLSNHINPAMGDRSLLAVATDRDGLTDFLASMPVGPSMVSTAYVLIRAVVNDAVKAGKLNNSRINGIPLKARSRRAEIIFPSYDQLCTLSDNMPDPYGPLIWLMRGCGLRIGEAMAVKWEDFHAGYLRVDEQLLASGLYGPLKHRKPGDFRDVPAPSYVMWRLDPDTELDNRYGYIFPKISRKTLMLYFNKARDAAGLDPSFTAHSLRHVFASVSLSNGIPITDVSAWLGHRDINMTYAIYGHLVPSSFVSARTVLDSEYQAWKEAR